MFDDGDLLSEFIDETAEHLISTQNGLIALDRQSAHGGIKSVTIDMVFRSIHTIKGGSGFLGLDNLQLLTHRMEELLSRVRDGE